MTKMHTRQRGFFSVGIGLALFAVFGAASFGLSSGRPHGDSLEAKQQMETPVSTSQIAKQTHN